MFWIPGPTFFFFIRFCWFYSRLVLLVLYSWLFFLVLFPVGFVGWLEAGPYVRASLARLFTVSHRLLPRLAQQSVSDAGH